MTVWLCPWGCGSPTAEDKTSVASCSPPRGGGGELRGSKNRNIYTR